MASATRFHSPIFMLQKSSNKTCLNDFINNINIDEKDTTQDDYSVALFTAIEEKEYSKAMLRANKWLKRFPESDMLYAFRWRLYRERNEQINALNDLNLAVAMNPRNAVALFNLWIMNFEKNDYTLARQYFENTIESDKNGTFWNEAEHKLKELKTIEEKIYSQTWETNNWNW